jgi:restriction endonuclease S subunit
MVDIGGVCTLINGRAFKPSDWRRADSGGLPIVRIQNLNDDTAGFNYFTGDVSARNIIEPGELLFSWSGSRGSSFGAHIWPGPKAVLNQHIFKIEFFPERADKVFLLHALNGVVAEVEDNLHGGVGLVHITKGNLERIKIPLPPLETQRAIVAEIEAEQALVNANRELIGRMEKKIQATLARIWGKSRNRHKKHKRHRTEEAGKNQATYLLKTPLVCYVLFVANLNRG